MYRSRTPPTVGESREGRGQDLSQGLISQIDLAAAGIPLDPSLDPLYLGFQRSVTNDQSYYTKDLMFGPLQEEREMASPFPKWSVLMLEQSDVNSLRKEFNAARKMGFDLIGIRFDDLDPRYTPESKARMGVYIIQIASFSKQNVLASLPPGRHGGKVDERFLPELVRLELLMTLASQGFAWLELEDDIPGTELSELIDRAKRSGTSVLLSRYQKADEKWVPPPPDILGSVDGYKLNISVSSGGDLRKVLSLSQLVKNAIQGKIRMINPIGTGIAELKWLSPVLGSDLMLLDAPMETENGVLDPIRTRSEAPMDFWKRTGMIGEGSLKGWSLLNREIGEDTRIIAQIGRMGDADARIPLHNSIFSRMGTDAAVLPWYVSRGNVDRFFRNVRNLGLNGILVDMPHVNNVARHLDWIDPNSRAAGALTLVLAKDGKLFGYNTEMYAVMDVLKDRVRSKDRVLVLGFGASGKSAALAARTLGTSVSISGSTIERTLEVALTLGTGVEAVTYQDLRKGGNGYDLIINTLPADLPLGKSGEGLTIANMVREMEASVGLEMVRSSKWTPFLSSVESRGGEAIPGTEVLAHMVIRDQKLMMDSVISEEMLGEILSEM